MFMFGFKYIKFDSMTYVIHYKNGKIIREGRGLSFFYFAPDSSIVAIPVGSSDIQFVFNESTADFQTISIQGQIIYKVENPKHLAELLDFTVDKNGTYKKKDHEKLNQRLIGEAQTATSAFIQSLTLKESLRSAKKIEEKIITGLHESNAVSILGVTPLSANILAVRATPEMERALEADTREALQQQADHAIYERRNYAVEQERTIRESELSTEIAVQEKNKQIAEKKMEAEILIEQNKRRIREMQVEADIAVERHRKTLIDIKVENERKEADSKGYVLTATLKPYKDMDWKTLSVINKDALDPTLTIAMAFRELAERADKIGTLNISPELLDRLLNTERKK
ncbi:Band 7 protein [Candidatus Magnetobacterium bavaricum]|uniref:Band 7 protein n=1 Tax=Candidatus Magnetobacterium bavaricum TaxID=29290 RepID=A0A0F3GTV9_9BACT|nr:Band 7 protein [Candidatus Magnetobacterium bavaricum]